MAMLQLWQDLAADEGGQSHAVQNSESIQSFQDNPQADTALLATSQDLAADKGAPCHTVQISKPIKSIQKTPKAGTMMLTMWENLAAAEGGRDQDFKTPEPNPDAFPFVKLPSEIRNMVYKDLVSAGSLGWQSVIERLSKLQAQRTPRKKDRKPECHSTSAILLVNRQIHMEAIQVLYSTVFELPFPVNIKTMKRFFCKGVFEQIRYVTFIIDIDKEESQIMDSIFSFKEQELEGTWLEMIKFLPLLWSEQHSLRHLRVIITTNRSLRSSIFSQPVRRRIMAFSTLRGIEQVSIEQKERVEVPRHRLPRVVYLLAQLDEL